MTDAFNPLRRAWITALHDMADRIDPPHRDALMQMTPPPWVTSPPGSDMPDNTESEIDSEALRAIRVFHSRRQRGDAHGAMVAHDYALLHVEMNAGPDASQRLAERLKADAARIWREHLARDPQA